MRVFVFSLLPVFGVLCQPGTTPPAMDAQLTKAGVSDSWSFKGAVDAEPLLDVGDSVRNSALI